MCACGEKIVIFVVVFSLVVFFFFDVYVYSNSGHQDTDWISRGCCMALFSGAV